MSSKAPLYVVLASTIHAIANCVKNGNEEWYKRHTEKAEALAREYLPSGSGVDTGTAIDVLASTPDKLVLSASFHHMDEYGSYDGWTEHTLTVRPSLAFGFTLTISGRNRNDIKDYLHEVFDIALRQEVERY